MDRRLPAQKLPQIKFPVLKTIWAVLLINGIFGSEETLADAADTADVVRVYLPANTDNGVVDDTISRILLLRVVPSSSVQSMRLHISRWRDRCSSASQCVARFFKTESLSLHRPAAGGTDIHRREGRASAGQMFVSVPHCFSSVARSASVERSESVRKYPRTFGRGGAAQASAKSA